MINKEINSRLHGDFYIRYLTVFHKEHDLPRTTLTKGRDRVTDPGGGDCLRARSLNTWFWIYFEIFFHIPYKAIVFDQLFHICVYLRNLIPDTLNDFHSFLWQS